MKSPFPFIFALALATACSVLRPNPVDPVRLETVLSPQDASSHMDLGRLVFSESSEFDGDEDDARDKLRYAATRMGADLVVLPVPARVPCEMNHEKKCVVLEGRAYRNVNSSAAPPK